MININPQNSVANDSAHQNIRIEDNEFVLRSETAVGARSTKGLTVTGNTIRSDREVSDELSIKTSDCSDVEIGNNRY